MKILLLGSNGQVGWELRRALAPLGVITAPDWRAQGGLDGDLEDTKGLSATIRQVEPDVIVNAAAYTAVDQAESEPSRARRINAEAPAVLAEEARALGAVLVHYSTDYVFDGNGERPWNEDDPIAPINMYGQTKWEGEEAIRESGCRHLIFRTSWVYAPRGKNFLKTMLRLAVSRKELQVVDDQVGAPTGAELIADVTAQVIPRLLGTDADGQGTYHLAPHGETSWYGYASHLIDCARVQEMEIMAERIQPVSSDVFPTPARRPKNSRLDCSRLEQAFGLELPDWKDGVQRTLTELCECNWTGRTG